MSEDIPKTPADDPLTPEQKEAFARAWEEARKILVAGKIAVFNGWALLVLGGLSALLGLGSLRAMLTGGALLALGWNELRGRTLLHRFDPTGPRILGWNQLALMGVIILYCGWGIYRALNVPNPQIARPEPPLPHLSGRLRGLVPVAQEHHGVRRADANLPRHPRRHLGAARVEHRHLVPRHGQPHAPGLHLHRGMAGGDHEVALRLPVDLVDRRAQRLRRPVVQVRAQTLAPRPHRADVHVLRHLRRPHELERRRRQEKRPDAMRPDQPEGRLGIELPHPVRDERHAPQSHHKPDVNGNRHRHADERRSGRDAPGTVVRAHQPARRNARGLDAAV